MPRWPDGAEAEPNNWVRLYPGLSVWHVQLTPGRGTNSLGVENHFSLTDRDEGINEEGSDYLCEHFWAEPTGLPGWFTLSSSRTGSKDSFNFNPLQLPATGRHWTRMTQKPHSMRSMADSWRPTCGNSQSVFVDDLISRDRWKFKVSLYVFLKQDLRGHSSPKRVAYTPSKGK